MIPRADALARTPRSAWHITVALIGWVFGRREG